MDSEPDDLHRERAIRRKEAFEERKAPDDWMNRNNGEPNMLRGGTAPALPGPRAKEEKRPPGPPRDGRSQLPRPDTRKP